MTNTRHCGVTLFLALTVIQLLAIGPVAAAQARRVFEDRPIQVVVGFPAGGILDTVSRILAGRMARDLGTQIVTVPNPGAGGAIAMQRVARGTSDGHTLMLIPSTSLLARPLILGINLDQRDFVPVATVAINFTMIAVKNDHRWKSLGDLIKEAKANPGKLSYAVPGLGGNPHFAMELVSRAAGIRVVAIPYQGSPQAILAVLGNEADFVVTDNTHPQIRALATLNAKRSPFQPGVPTLRELGFDVELFSRFNLVAPIGTPNARIEALEEAARVAVEDPEVRKALERQQLEPMFEPGKHVRKVWQEQAVVYKRLITELGLAYQKPAGAAPAAKR